MQTSPLKAQPIPTPRLLPKGKGEEEEPDPCFFQAMICNQRFGLLCGGGLPRGLNFWRMEISSCLHTSPRPRSHQRQLMEEGSMLASEAPHT